MRFTPLVLVVVPILCIAADADDAKKELEKFQGTWSARRYVVDGKALDDKDVKSFTLTVKENMSTFRHGDKVATGTYTLRPGKSPKELDIAVTDGPMKGKSFPAIYEFDGEELRICIARDGKERPRKFVSEPGSKNDLEVWRRQK